MRHLKTFCGLLLLLTILNDVSLQCLSPISSIQTEFSFDGSQQIQIREEIKIPVVFHIVYENDQENISDEQVLSQLEVINQDFNFENPRLGDLPSAFENLAANIDIEFCLALQDPDGMETNGITRRKTQVVDIGLTEKYYDFSQGGQDAWDTDRYLNIWVASFGNSNIQGYGHFPDALPKEKDGIIVNFKYFGTVGTAEMPHDLGSSCTHEIGHYLNVRHIWGSEFSCDSDDGLDDTPLQFGPTIDCPAFPKPDECTQGDGILFYNFMDYTDDACVSMFTHDQKEVMLSTLMTTRSSLIENSDLCTVYNREIFNKNEISIYPNPFTNYISISLPGISKNIQIFNSRGVLMEELYIKNEGIDTSSYPIGMYFVKINDQLIKMIKIQ